MTRGRILAYGLIVLAAVCATSGCGGGSSFSLNPPPPHQKSGFQYKGITHVSWQSSEYNAAAATNSQDALAATGANWAGVLVTQYQANATATTIAPASNTPTDSAVIAAIRELRSNGLRVMLKPHVDLLDGDWRGNINPTDVDAWFASYTDFIVSYARLARDESVEMLSFGTELKVMTGAANRDRWIAVINAIRSAGGYAGLLTYAANAAAAGDEFTSVSFWDQVDIIGLDAYFPLTDRNDPTVSQLVSAWSLNRWGENIVANVQNFANAHTPKSVIFTEIGYRSVDGANTAPWDFSRPGAADTGEQRDCYEAMYEVWSPQNSWMKGNFWWDWPVPVPAANDTDYNPRNKPAETVLRDWQ